MDALSRCEESIRTSEQNIHDTAINFIQEIRANEKQTVEELHNIYGSDCMEYMDCKKDLAVQVYCKKGKSSPYSISERRVPELIPVLGSQPAGDVNHKPGGRLSLLSARPAVIPATFKRAATNFAAW